MQQVFRIAIIGLVTFGMSSLLAVTGDKEIKAYNENKIEPKDGTLGEIKGGPVDPPKATEGDGHRLFGEGELPPIPELPDFDDDLTKVNDPAQADGQRTVEGVLGAGDDGEGVPPPTQGTGASGGGHQ